MMFSHNIGHWPIQRDAEFLINRYVKRIPFSAEIGYGVLGIKLFLLAPNPPPLPLPHPRHQAAHPFKKYYVRAADQEDPQNNDLSQKLISKVQGTKLRRIICELTRFISFSFQNHVFPLALQIRPMLLSHVSRK